MQDETTPLLLSVHLENNYAASQGGGAFAGDFSQLTMEGCTLQNNTAGAGNGGGVYIIDYTDLHLHNCTFIENDAVSGGGLYIKSRTEDCEVADCTFERNRANLEGGALSTGSSAVVSVRNCKFLKNSVAQGDGGAVFIRSSAHPTIVDCIIADNFAWALGGGLMMSDLSETKASNITVLCVLCGCSLC